jgi:flagellar biogenesis protein FliO
MEQGLGILLILGLASAAAWMLKRKRLSLSGPNSRLQVLERVALTPQHSLCLVRVDGRVIIAATAPNGTQILEVAEK